MTRPRPPQKPKSENTTASPRPSRVVDPVEQARLKRAEAERKAAEAHAEFERGVLARGVARHHVVGVESDLSLERERLRNAQRSEGEYEHKEGDALRAIPTHKERVDTLKVKREIVREDERQRITEQESARNEYREARRTASAAERDEKKITMEEQKALKENSLLAIETYVAGEILKNKNMDAVFNSLTTDENRARMFKKYFMDKKSGNVTTASLQQAQEFAQLAYAVITANPKLEKRFDESILEYMNKRIQIDRNFDPESFQRSIMTAKNNGRDIYLDMLIGRLEQGFNLAQTDEKGFEEINRSLKNLERIQPDFNSFSDQEIALVSDCIVSMIYREMIFLDDDDLKNESMATISKYKKLLDSVDPARLPEIENDLMKKVENPIQYAINILKENQLQENEYEVDIIKKLQIIKLAIFTLDDPRLSSEVKQIGRDDKKMILASLNELLSNYQTVQQPGDKVDFTSLQQLLGPTPKQARPDPTARRYEGLTMNRPTEPAAAPAEPAASNNSSMGLLLNRGLVTQNSLRVQIETPAQPKPQAPARTVVQPKDTTPEPAAPDLTGAAPVQEDRQKNRRTF